MREVAIHFAKDNYNLDVVRMDVRHGYHIKHEPDRGSFCWTLNSPSGLYIDGWQRFQLVVDQADHRIDLHLANLAA